jgi:hypothetical protein
VAGLFVGALVIGGVVAVSRRGPDSAVAPTTTADVASPSTTSEPPTPSAAPTESYPRVAPPVRTVVGSGPLLGEPTGLDVWLQVNFEGRDVGGVYRVNLDQRTLHQAEAQTSFGFPALASADRDGFHQATNYFTTVRADGTVTKSSESFNGQPLAATEDGFWVKKFPDGGLGLVVLERRLYDGSIVDRVSLPTFAYASRGFGRNRFIIQGRDGRSFRFDALDQSLTPLRGGAAALTPTTNTYATVVCDDKLLCQMLVVDDAGGEWPIDAPEQAVVTISPDEQYVTLETFVFGNNGTIVAGVVVRNIRTGESVDLGSSLGADGSSNNPTSRWSPDGRWLIFPRADGVAAWRPGLESPIVIPIGTGKMHTEAFAVGPTAG